MTIDTLTREDWLTEALAFIFDDIIAPHMPDDWQAPATRVSVGFASARATKIAAVYYKKEAAADGIAQIYVTPAIDDSVEVLAALLHEAIHSLDDAASGHRGLFARVARAVWLEGPLTATYARKGSALYAQLADIVGLLGAIPHVKLDLTKRKKQATRMIKVRCTACDFHFRTTQVQINKIDFPEAPCPACGTHRRLHCPR